MKQNAIPNDFINSNRYKFPVEQISDFFGISTCTKCIMSFFIKIFLLRFDVQLFVRHLNLKQA